MKKPLIHHTYKSFALCTILLSVLLASGISLAQSSQIFPPENVRLDGLYIGMQLEEALRTLPSLKVAEGKSSIDQNGNKTILGYVGILFEGDSQRLRVSFSADSAGRQIFRIVQEQLFQNENLIEDIVKTSKEKYGNSINIKCAGFFVNFSCRETDGVIQIYWGEAVLNDSGKINYSQSAGFIAVRAYLSAHHEINVETEFFGDLVYKKHLDALETR